jgi:atlastin
LYGKLRTANWLISSRENNEIQDNDLVSNKRVTKKSKDLTAENKKLLPLIEKTDEGLKLNEKTIKDLFENNFELDGMDIALLAIIGPEREGKSFTLNFIMRYLKLNYFGTPDAELEGFAWKSGIDSQTKGIFIWREPFIKKIDNKKCAIFLIDTQVSLNSNSFLRKITLALIL